MGSTYFYLEFLIAWLTRLKERGFKSPAIFALEYTLVPDAVWPKQFRETCIGYRLLVDYMGDSSKICVSGDSAGATLIMSRLLHHGDYDEEPVIFETKKPALAVLISPWTHLISHLNRNTPSDYLDAKSLELYGGQYIGKESPYNDIISPGLTDGRWKLTQPTRGYCITYGSEEVFAPAIEETLHNMKEDGARVKVKREPGGIHAWPVVNLFLGSTKEERLKGLNVITEMVVSRMQAVKAVKAIETPKKTREDLPVQAYPSPSTPTPSRWSPMSYFGS
jgi:acetyl esterase/lipase